MPSALNLPIDSVRFDAGVDGNRVIQLDAANIPLDGTMDWGYYVSDYGYQDLGNGWYVAVESSRYPSGDNSTRVEVNHFASDDVVFSWWLDYTAAGAVVSRFNRRLANNRNLGVNARIGFRPAPQSPEPTDQANNEKGAIV